MRLAVFTFLIFLTTTCTTVHKTGIPEPLKRLHFIGEYHLPQNLKFQNTMVGGISGIDYNAGRDEYYLVCDDRSDLNPARFYTAKIPVTEKGIDTVLITGVTSFLQPGGSVYPGSKQDPLKAPDPEALRFDPSRNELVWASEGERIVENGRQILQDPGLNIIGSGGDFKSSFILPGNMHMKSGNEGPRRNGVFEGLSFTHNYRSLLVSLEEPLFQDGSRAGLNDSTAWIRILRYDRKTRISTEQYGYQLDPVAKAPVPSSAFRINGISDILSLDDHQLLVVERSFSTGTKGCTIKLFLADLKHAGNIFDYPSLVSLPFHPITKKLLLNLDELGIFIDNVEGVSFGPRLPNGHQSLVFVTDNNFSSGEITQFLLFELE